MPAANCDVDPPEAQEYLMELMDELLLSQPVFPGFFEAKQAPKSLLREKNLIANNSLFSEDATFVYTSV